MSGMKALVIALALMAPAAFGATRTWIGTSGMKWSNPASWNGGVPMTGDDVVLPLVQCTNDLPPGLQLNSIRVDGPGHITGNDIVLGAGGLHTSNPAVSIGGISLRFSGIVLSASQSWTSPAYAGSVGVGPTNVNGQTLTLNSARLSIESLAGEGAIIQKAGQGGAGASTYTGTITVVDGGTFSLDGTAGAAEVDDGTLSLATASLGSITVHGRGTLSVGTSSFGTPVATAI
jgi:hypothetical protein